MQTQTLEPASIIKNINNLIPNQTEAIQRIDAWFKLERNRRKIFSHAGQINEVAELEGGKFSYDYNRRGDLIQIGESNGRRTIFEYDDLHRLTRVNYPDETTTKYIYGENDRLVQINDRGVLSHFDHDSKGRMTKIRQGNAGAAIYRYDKKGQIVEARTSVVSTKQHFDDQGRITSICQTINGVSLDLRLIYDENGRLFEMFLPGSNPIQYKWDSKARPQSIKINGKQFARFEYVDDQKLTRTYLSNGIIEVTMADPIDCRPAKRQVLKGDKILFQRENTYNPTNQIFSDGNRQYKYDKLGRLTYVEELDRSYKWSFSYDNMDNRTKMEDADGVYLYQYSSDNRLMQIQQPGGRNIQIDYDTFGKPIRKTSTSSQWIYRYNDAGQLLQVLCNGDTKAKFIYDHKGRLVLSKYSNRTERYLYGPEDELLAVTDEKGNPLRLYLRTPLGLLAEIHGSLDSGEMYFRHQDDHGTCFLITDCNAKIVNKFSYSPYGLPTSSNGDFLPVFKGRHWNPKIKMYNFGARWHEPGSGRFLTPDPYTGRPDDARIVHPIGPASQQAMVRAQILADWLKQPRVRNRYAFCSNDPLNRVDPNGHWSFGWILLSILGAIWTLPNTLFGLIIEITCLIGEVVRWLVWLVSFGNVSWATPGFDVAASDHLNAFALVFKGGWLGSFSSLLGITFGNVFFVYDKWEEYPNYAAEGEVYPPAYDGKVAIPRKDILYEHELRHTNQYGWFGPFFHLGPTVFGVYLWDIIINRGYWNAWLERDARDHSEGPETSTVPATLPEEPIPATESRVGGLFVHIQDEDNNPFGGELNLSGRKNEFSVKLNANGFGFGHEIKPGIYKGCIQHWQLHEMSNYESMGNIDGRVWLDSSSWPAKVTIYRSSDHTKITTLIVESDGKFNIQNLPPDNYIISIEGHKITRVGS